MVHKKINKINLISIVLPTYNEAGNIIDLIKEIEQNVKGGKEIIVIDDNSPDGTSNLVKSWIQKTKSKNIFLKTRYKNPGLTNSIRDGIKLSKGDVVVWMDCDLSMPPEVINQLLAKIREGYDIAVGSRYVNGGGIVVETRVDKKDSLLLMMLSRWMNMSFLYLLGKQFKDYTSGFIAVRKHVFKNIELRGDYGEYFIGLIYKAYAYKYKVTEIPYICFPRKHGVSKTGTNVWQYLKRGQKYKTLTFRLLVEKHLLHTIP